MRNLGLIGGLGPGATVHYYRELAEAQTGEMLVIHADMDRVLGDVQRGDRSGLASYFARLIERLARGGAEIAAISAITPHFCIRELQKTLGASPGECRRCSGARNSLVLAGTDLALIFDETNTDFEHVDGAKAHIAAISRDVG